MKNPMSDIIKIMVGGMIIKTINILDARIKEFEESNHRSPTAAEIGRMVEDISYQDIVVI
jgi:hypothetical protein